MALALTASFLFMVASVRVWGWLLHTIVWEQRCYEESRVRAGRNINPGLAVATPPAFGGGPAPAFHNPFWNVQPKLSVFNEESVASVKCP